MQIRQGVKNTLALYLDNPVLVVPFALLGLLDIFLKLSAKFALQNKSQLFGFENFETLLLTRTLSGELLQNIVNYAIAFILITIFLKVVSAFVQAYAIGLSNKIISGKKVSLADGLESVKYGVQIFIYEIAITALILFGAFVIILPAVILFGWAGALIATLLLVVYIVTILVITFFAPQSIVLEKKSPWNAIVRSYFFIRKHAESVVKLIAVIGIVFVCFTIIDKAVMSVMPSILAGKGLALFNNGVRFILFSLVFSPYLVILKTYFFLKETG